MHLDSRKRKVNLAYLLEVYLPGAGCLVSLPSTIMRPSFLENATN